MNAISLIQERYGPATGAALPAMATKFTELVKDAPFAQASKQMQAVLESPKAKEAFKALAQVDSRLKALANVDIASALAPFINEQQRMIDQIEASPFGSGTGTPGEIYFPLKNMDAMISASHSAFDKFVASIRISEMINDEANSPKRPELN